MAGPITQRTGSHGQYYAGNNWLNEAQQRVNVTYIASYLMSKGWALESVAGICGNLQHESTINPGTWEQLLDGTPCYVYYDWGQSPAGGGLVGWTPGCTRLLAWASNLGVPWDSMDFQLDELDFEFINNRDGKGYTTGGSVFYRRYAHDLVGTVDMTHNQFRANAGGWTPEQLAINFLWYYESPWAPNASAIANHNYNRSTAARKWYNYLVNAGPPGPWTSRKRMKPWMMIGLVNPDNL